MNSLVKANDDVNLDLNNFNLPKEKMDLIVSELDKSPSLFTIVTTFYKYDFYEGLDYLYEKYNSQLTNDNFMESIFLFLTQLAKEEKIEYFWLKNKIAIEQRPSFDKSYIYRQISNKNSNNSTDIINYCGYQFNPIFDEGLKVLCKKKKVNILKSLYEKGFKPSLAQLKVATRTLNEDTFYVVFNEMNKDIIDDYIPKLIEELCQYSKLEPIKFLFENIGADYMTQDSLDKSLVNSVKGNALKSKLELFKYIMNLGANIKANDYKVLELVFGYGHIDILDFLYNNGLENDKEFDLEKYVDIAIKYDRADVIKYLLENNKYQNNNYNLLEDKEIIIKYCKEFNKYKDTLQYLISNIYSDDKMFVNQLLDMYPKQRKLKEFLKSLI